MGEVCTDERDDAVAYLGDGSDTLHLSFYLDFARVRWSAERFRESVGWLEEHIPAEGWPCYYLNNHDMSRTFTRLGGGRFAEARAKSGCRDAAHVEGNSHHLRRRGDRDADEQGASARDEGSARHEVLAAIQGRDGARTPMQWDATPNAGFTSGEPWLPVDSCYTTRNVERQSKDPNSLLSWYRRLIRLRAAKPALHVGDYRVIDDVPLGVYAYVRQWENERVAVVLNFTPRTVSLPEGLDASAAEDWTRLLSSHDGEAGSARGAHRRLRPHEVLILEASD